MLFKHNSHKAILTGIIAIALLAFTACSSDDNETDGTVPQGGLRVSIPAVMGSDDDTRAVTITNNAASTSFSSSDVVYVYNVNTRSMDANQLTPNKNGKSVTLEGELANISYQAGDRLYLFYNMNAPASSSFNYANQTGTSASAGTKDFAVATVTVKAIVSGELETTSTAFFTNVQSIFRLSFSFADFNGSSIATTPTIVSLTIGSSRLSIATDYAPLAAEGSQYTPGSITLPNPNMAGDIYFSAPFNESLTNQYDDLIFTATDNNNIVYTGKKEAPLSGFLNGQYYYSDTPITLTNTTRYISVGVIEYLNRTSNYYVHYWGTGFDGDVLLTAPSPQSTESKSVGNDFWDNYPQTFYMLNPAEVPSNITGFKIVLDSNANSIIESEDSWFGDDADASKSKAYIFEWGGVNRAYYE